MEEKILRDLSERITFLRHLSIIADVFSGIQLIVAVVLPDLLDMFVKLWLVVIVACVLAGLLVALFLSRKDSTITLLLSMISFFITGCIFGISLVVFVGRVKNG